MDLDDSLNAAARVLRRRPTEVLPPFLADSALAVVAQLSLVAGAVGLFVVRGTERVQRLLTAVADLDPPITDAEAAALETALADLLTPSGIAVLAASGLLAVVLVVLVRSAAGAAKVHAAWAAVSDRDPCEAAVGGTLADTWAFVRLTLLQVLLFVGPLALGVAGAVGVGGEAGLAVAGLAVLAWIPVALATYFLLLFVPEIVVVEGVGVLSAIRRNLSFLAAHPGRAVVFGLLELGALFVVGGVGGALDAFGVGRLTALITLFLAIPFLGLVKMGLYVTPGEAGVSAGSRPDPGAGAGAGAGVDEEWTTYGGPDDRGRGRRADRERRPREDRPRGDPGRDDPRGPDRRRAPDDPARDRDERPGGPDPRDRDRSPRERAAVRRPGPEAEPGRAVGGRSLLGDLRSVFRAGVGELRGFVGAHLLLVAVALAAFFAGVFAGFRVTAATGVELVTAPPTRDIFGPFPLDTAVDLTANNWQVAIGQAYSGVAFGLPVLGNLAFNGAVVGGLAGLGFDLATFAALVVPHGVIEIPALAVAGAVGLWLAGRGWALVRGRTDPEGAGDDLRRGFLVLLGLAPVFLVAGFVEAFLTPWIAELLVG